MSRKRIYLTGLAIVIIVLAGVFFAFRFNAQKRLKEVTKQIPDYFTKDSKNLSSFVLSDAKNIPLRQTESTAEGVKYEVQKPMLKAVEDVVSDMKAGGWVAVSGTTQSASSTVLKLNNGKETMLVLFQALSGEKTEVKILPIIKK